MYGTRTVLAKRPAFALCAAWHLPCEDTIDSRFLSDGGKLKDIDTPRRYKLIACEIMYREFCFCAAQSRNVVDATFLPKGLHDMGESKMSAQLQAAVDDVDPTRYQAIMLGYGLCNNGTRNLRASVPIIIPRAHDCITLLLGSKEKYLEYFQQHPGTYYKSPGWVERNRDPNGNPDSIMSQLQINRTYEEYAAKFGEENARYLMETLGDWMKHYTRLAYIDTRVGSFDEYKRQTEDEAREKGWEYEEIQGSTALLMRLLDGPWDSDDFLVVPPGQTIRPTYDDTIIDLA